MLVVDLLMLPDRDLALMRSLPVLAGLAVLNAAIIDKNRSADAGEPPR